MQTTLASNLSLSRRQHGLALATLCLAVLIAQVDTAVVNLAVRPIGQAFSAGMGALQWVVDGYNLVYAVMLLTGGLLADLKGRRLVFMAGAAIFLASKAGDYVVGDTITVDGGLVHGDLKTSIDA